MNEGVTKWLFWKRSNIHNKAEIQRDSKKGRKRETEEGEMSGKDKDGTREMDEKETDTDGKIRGDKDTSRE